LIDWCLAPTLAVFQIHRGVNKLYILDTLILGDKPYIPIYIRHPYS